MPVQIHYFKCWPEPFGAMSVGTKTHEIRKDDRPIRPRVGDLVVLQEWQPQEGTVRAAVEGRFGKHACNTDSPDDCARKDLHRDPAAEGDYTGRDLRRRVTYVTEPGQWGLAPDTYVMSLREEANR
jgi:hypothetical protein